MVIVVTVHGGILAAYISRIQQNKNRMLANTISRQGKASKYNDALSLSALDMSTSNLRPHSTWRIGDVDRGVNGVTWCQLRQVVASNCIIIRSEI
jgi:hypothetical protein